MLLCSSSETAFKHCSQVIAKGIYDETLYNDDYHARKFMVAEACKTFDSYSGSSDARWHKECSGSSSGTSGSLGVDAVVEAVPVGLDLGYGEFTVGFSSVSRIVL